VSRTIKLALQAAHEAVQTATTPLTGVRPVFASAWGDLEILDRILTALTQPERPVSPTHFHNSVHNAAAGYWSIGTGATVPASAIAADQATFAAGLLEAATMVATDGAPAMLVAYDLTPPLALSQAVAVAQPFGTALLLCAGSVAGCAEMELGLEAEGVVDQLPEPILERVRQSNPIAAALPLLRALAQERGNVRLPYHGRGILRATVHAGAR
jgi:hypothetical protein